MKPMPIVYVTDMEASLAWYTTLVDSATVVSSSPYWSQLDIDGAALALHYTDEPAGPGPHPVGLSLQAPAPLEDLYRRLAAAGTTPHREIADEAFGRSMVYRDPDGLLIQVNEHDPELYPQ